MIAVRLRLYFPYLVILWVFGLLAGTLSGLQLLRANPLALDVQVFEPGAVYLAESLRVLSKDWLRAAGRSALSLFSAHLLLTLVRAGLARQVMDLHLNEPRPALLSFGIGKYFGLYLLQLVALSSASALFFWAGTYLPSGHGTLAPVPLALRLIFGAGAALFLLVGLVLLELWRLAIFSAKARSSFGLARECLGRYPQRLLFLRGVRAGFTILITATVLRLSLTPFGQGASGAAVTLFSVQALVILSLLFEVYWLDFAGRHLRITRLLKRRRRPR
jgi:hypothetical protein